MESGDRDDKCPSVLEGTYFPLVLPYCLAVPCRIPLLRWPFSPIVHIQIRKWFSKTLSTCWVLLCRLVVVLNVVRCLSFPNWLTYIVICRRSILVLTMVDFTRTANSVLKVGVKNFRNWFLVTTISSTFSLSGRTHT